MPDVPATSPADPVSSSLPAPEVEGYTFLRRIGRGSYGDVWLARDATGALRAVKVVYRKTFEHDRPFEREYSGIQRFEPVSRSHPSQVSIVQVGRNDAEGYFYYVMELADDAETGPRIDPARYVPKTIRSELSRRGRIPYAECLEIGLSLTTALEHLHQHGLIHRDVKPSNIIFVQGVPKLADIGLVTDLGASISYVGTEGFLPPEGPVSPQADIYSLGKVLYEMSTGRDRFEFPELPSFLGDETQKLQLLELNLVFLKACQNDLDRRYRTAQAMAADLALLRSGRSLREARQRQRRWVWMARVAAGLLLAATIAWAGHRLNRRAAQRQKEAAAEITRQALKIGEIDSAGFRQRLVNACVANGVQATNQGDWAGALLWFATAAQGATPGAATQAEHAARLQTVLEKCPRVVAVFAHNAAVNAGAFTTDGRFLLTAGDDATAKLWNLASRMSPAMPQAHSDAVLGVDVDPAGELALTASGNAAHLWKLPSWERATAAPLAHDVPVRRAKFSPRGREVLTLADDPVARLWLVSGGRLRHSFQHGPKLHDAAFAAGGDKVLTAGEDGSVKSWNVEHGELDAEFRHGSPVMCLSVAPDGRRFAAGAGNDVRVWQVDHPEAPDHVLPLNAAVHAVAFSPDGAAVAAGGADHAIRVWDAALWQMLLPPLLMDGPVTAVAFSPSGRQLAASVGHRAQIFDARSGAAVSGGIWLNKAVRAIRWSPEGDALLVAGADGTARLWQPGRWPGEGTPPPATAPPGSSLAPLAEFLSGRRIDTDHHPIPVPTGEWAALSARIAAEFPAVVAPLDLGSWHRRRAQALHDEEDWSAAIFHWDRFLAMTGTDATALRQRQAAAKNFAAAAAARRIRTAERLPARPTNAPPQLLDLSAYYNAALTETWLPTNAIVLPNDLSELPRGVIRLQGIEFDVRGLIQLSSSTAENEGARFPQEVTGIPVGRPCLALTFLLGTAWKDRPEKVIGGYRVHYANGEVENLKIQYAVDVVDWWDFSSYLKTKGGIAMAWEGSNPASRAMHQKVRLYTRTWKTKYSNVVDVVSLDFYSTGADSAPFVVAIRAE